MAKNIFSRGANGGVISFYQFKNYENSFLLLKIK